MVSPSRCNLYIKMCIYGVHNIKHDLLYNINTYFWIHKILLCFYLYFITTTGRHGFVVPIMKRMLSTAISLPGGFIRFYRYDENVLVFYESTVIYHSRLSCFVHAISDDQQCSNYYYLQITIWVYQRLLF